VKKSGGSRKKREHSADSFRGEESNNETSRGNRRDGEFKWGRREGGTKGEPLYMKAGRLSCRRDAHADSGGGEFNNKMIKIE